MVRILAIETSCDETSAAIIENGRKVLSNIVYTQIDTHKKFGGVVPEVASREHVEKIDMVVKSALSDAKMNFSELDAVAVTAGPGLVGPLLVGVSYAKGLAYSAEKPLIAVNHIDGHISANYLAFPELQPPFLSLIVSGGHTHFVDVKDYGEYEVLGKTRDDAIGEAYDKVARTLGLPYPGGPHLDRLAKEGDREAIVFPRTTLSKDSLDFSFSGIKSAVLNYVNNEKQKGNEIVPADVAASFQEAVLDVLISKIELAARATGHSTVVIAGGVAANTRLRERLNETDGLIVKFPPLSLCTDNAAMIGSAAHYAYLKGKYASLDLNADPSLRI